MSTHAAPDERWRASYEKAAGRAPRDTLLLALEGFGADVTGTAIDVGCGGGRDTVALLSRGWQVLAVDGEPAALDCVRNRPDLPAGARVRTRLARFESFADLDWPRVDLVNASFCLPLCPPERFAAFWRTLREALAPGGRISGQLFGPRDAWAGDPSVTCHTRAQVGVLLRGLAIEHLWEEETDAVTPRGRTKHWHIFHLVARNGDGATSVPGKRRRSALRGE